MTMAVVIFVADLPHGLALGAISDREHFRFYQITKPIHEFCAVNVGFVIVEPEPVIKDYVYCFFIEMLSAEFHLGFSYQLLYMLLKEYPLLTLLYSFEPLIAIFELQLLLFA